MNTLSAETILIIEKMSSNSMRVLLKKRICSFKEQILFFKSDPSLNDFQFYEGNSKRKEFALWRSGGGNSFL